MKYKNELDYVVMALNDYVARLDNTSKVAVTEKIQGCLKTIESGLLLNVGEDAAQVDEGAQPAQELLTEKQK